AVGAIAFGYIILRRPPAPRAAWIRVEENTGTLGADLGERIASTLEAVEELARASDEQVLTWHLRVAQDVSEERYYHPGQEDPNVILLRQGGGFARAVQ